MSVFWPAFTDDHEKSADIFSALQGGAFPVRKIGRAT